MRYDVILWDVDNTLLDFEYSQHFSLCKCLEEIGVTATEEMVACYSAINDGWWKRLERGEVTKPQLLTGRFLDFFAEYDIQCEDVDCFRAHYESYLGDAYRYLDDSLVICKSLRGKCKQYAVTNGVTAVATKKLTLSGFMAVFEGIFISEQLGCPKPQKAFFDKVFETMPDVPKDRILIVGDSLSSDMQGGINAGIATCWYNPHGAARPADKEITYEISKLNELENIFEVKINRFGKQRNS